MSKDVYYFVYTDEQTSDGIETDVYFGQRENLDDAQYIATFADRLDALDYCEWRNEEVENDLDDLVDVFEDDYTTYDDDIPEVDAEWTS